MDQWHVICWPESLEKEAPIYSAPTHTHTATNTSTAV